MNPNPDAFERELSALKRKALPAEWRAEILAAAEQAKSPTRTPRWLVVGWSAAYILFFHLAINVGMTIGLAPVIGIPLPLISYGGTSLVIFTVLIFILIRLDADRQMVLR